MIGPNHAIHRRRCDLEDVLAALAAIEDRRAVIFRHAWDDWPGSMECIYDEAHRMAADVAAVREFLSEHWHEITAVIEAARE